MTDTLVDTCLYVYGIIDSAAKSVADALGSDVRVVDAGPISAVCCRFDPDQLAAVGADESGTGLAELARQHDDLLRALTLHTAVLPMRLGTLCADESRLARTLQRSAAALAEQLDDVRDCAEWNVRVAFPSSRGEVSQFGADTADASGAAYLRGRREVRSLAMRERAAAEVGAHWLASRVEEIASASRVRAGSRPELLLAEAILVPRACQAVFDDVVVAARDELSAVGALVQVDGPLPPYSFVDIRLEVTP